MVEERKEPITLREEVFESFMCKMESADRLVCTSCDASWVRVASTPSGSFFMKEGASVVQELGNFTDDLEPNVVMNNG